MQNLRRKWYRYFYSLSFLCRDYSLENCLTYARTYLSPQNLFSLLFLSLLPPMNTILLNINWSDIVKLPPVSTNSPLFSAPSPPRLIRTSLLCRLANWGESHFLINQNMFWALQSDRIMSERDNWSYTRMESELTLDFNRLLNCPPWMCACLFLCTLKMWRDKVTSWYIPY